MRTSARTEDRRWNRKSSPRVTVETILCVAAVVAVIVVVILAACAGLWVVA